jgi:hypothetical protein
MREITVLMAVISFLVLAPSAGALDAVRDSTYFADLFVTFASEQEATRAQAKNPGDRETQLKTAIFYWLSAVQPIENIKKNTALLDKAQATVETLWKTDRKDNRTIYVLAEVYMSRCAALDMSKLDEIIAFVNKAQSLLNILVSRLPDNMDARLGRTQINMNLSPQTGRPDAVILDDAAVFMRGFDKLPEAEKKNPYFLMGKAQMQLAVVSVELDQGRLADATKLYREIDKSSLPPHLLAMYDSCGKRVGK